MICSSYGTLHFEISKLKRIFQSNEYPKNFFNRCIKKYLDKVFVKNPRNFNLKNFSILQIKSHFQISI